MAPVVSAAIARLAQGVSCIAMFDWASCQQQLMVHVLPCTILPTCCLHASKLRQGGKSWQESGKAYNAQERASLPTPNDTQVQFVQMPGGFYAVRSFSGKAGEEDAQKQLQVLYQKLARDKLQATPDKWTLARYNDPSTKGPFRLNEVLVEVVNFDLWGQDGIKEH